MERGKRPEDELEELRKEAERNAERDVRLDEALTAENIKAGVDSLILKIQLCVSDQTDIDAQIRSEGCRALKCEGLTARLEDVRSKLSAAHSNRCVVLITALEGLLYTLGELFCARVNSGADRERYQTAIAGYKRLLVKAEELAAAGYEA